jgi:hypothetical protein
MAILSPSPRLKFFDDSGVAVSYGLLYTYEAGTTTPLATYADSSGSVSNPNPVVLDVNGECVAYLGDSNYKFKLSTALDVQIWVQDNIDGQPIPDGAVTADGLATNAVTTAKILNSNVTYAKIQNVSSTDRVLGRSSSGAGVIEEIPFTSFARSLSDDATAAAALVTLGAALNSISNKTTSYAADETDRGKLIDFSTAGVTLTLPLAATAGAGFVLAIKNSAATGVVTIDRNGSTINSVAANATLDPGVSAFYICDGSGNWIVVGQSATYSGKLLQMSTTNTAAYSNITTEIPYDDTIPQITEGDELLTLAFTPLSATSKLVIEGSLIANHSGDGGVDTFALFKDSDANAIYAAFRAGPANSAGTMSFKYIVTAGSTTARTYKLRVGTDSPTTSSVQINGYNGARILGGVVVSSLTISEVAA